MSVTIHGIVCKNCWDVDWAKRVEAEDKKKADEEAAQKAKEANAPPGSKTDSKTDGKVDGSGGTDRASSFDSQPATVVDGRLKDPPSVDGSGAAAAVARSGHIGSTQPLLNIVV